MTKNNLKSLEKKAKVIRKDILELTYRAKLHPIASSLSTIELLLVLYYRILNISKDNYTSPDRDRFVLSKGHGCFGLYHILMDLDIIDKREWDKISQPTGKLGGHPESDIAGIEASTGSLGHGLPIACGIALAGKIDKKGYNVWCMISDGECDEGSTWEAALFAAHNKLTNLIVIADYNKIQSSGRVEEVVELKPLADKWRAFRWDVIEIDGHNLNIIYDTFKKVITTERKKPVMIIAHTIKGKGISYMEDNKEWHSLIPNEEQYKQGLEELL